MNKVILIDKDLPAYYAAPDTKGKHPGIILVHEVWGLTPHIRDVANRLAAAGYVVVAPNLFHGFSFAEHGLAKLFETFKDPTKRDEAQKKMREELAPIRTPDFARDTVKKLGHCFHYLTKDELTSETSIGVMGFCFGGSFAFAFAEKEPRLKAAVAFYGEPPEPLEKIATIVCPVLAFYGENDTRLIEKLDPLKDIMKQYEKNFEAVVYPDAAHAFFNDTNANMYRKDAAEDSWGKTLVFLEKYLVKE